MLLANYGSDSESGSDNEAGSSKPTVAAVAPKSTATTSTSTASSSKVKRKAPVKITLDLPRGSASGTGSRENADDEGRTMDSGDEGRDAKKVKTAGGPKGGKGSSSLLGMLPPPKRKVPAAKTGSGMTINKSIPKPIISVPKPAANLPAPPGHAGDEDSDDEDEMPKRGGMLLPPSVQRGQAKAKANEKAPALDLFGLSSDTGAGPSSSKVKSPAPPSMSISSAPVVADFAPPEPTPNDPYPGYYQLPSGDWAAHDPEYYHSFFPTSDHRSTQEEDEKGDGRVGRHWEEFNSKGADFIDIDVGKSLEEARAEKERRERMVKPKLPGDEVEYKAIGQIKGLATERHQLSSLLNTAYSQKEELEQRIASSKKNMRVAAQKYGF